MANFPTSVFSPAARSNGQVIDASHVNSLQEEVTAIEDGFRNATAPLNSSKSTLASLHVTGGSTLVGTLNVTTGNLNVIAGSLNVAGLSTIGVLTVTLGAYIAGNLQVDGPSTFASIPVMPRLPAVSVKPSQDINVENATPLTLNWLDEIFDADGLHSTTTNSSRINLTSSGVWMCGVQLGWASTSSYWPYSARIVLNNVEPLANVTHIQSTSVMSVFVQAQTLYLATSTSNYLTCDVTQFSGSSRMIEANPGNGRTVFWAYRVSQ